MPLGARSEAIAAFLLVWTVLRLLTKRRLFTGFFLAFALGCTGALVADASTLLGGAAHVVARGLVAAINLAAVGVFVETLRRENGARPAGRRTLLLIAAASAGLACLSAALPDRRGVTLLEIVFGTLMLGALAPLLGSGHRNAGSLVVGLGVIIYVVGRSAIIIANVVGDSRHVQFVADIASIAAFGVGFSVYAFAGKRSAAREAVGSRPTTA